QAPAPHRQARGRGGCRCRGCRPGGGSEVRSRGQRRTAEHDARRCPARLERDGSRGSMTDLRVAVGQYSATDVPEANAETAVGLVAQAAEAGARLVLLPEYALAWAARLRPDLGDGHEAFGAALGAAAAEHGIWVLAGTLEPAGERLLNTAVVFGPDGQRRGSYTKVHLFDAFGVRESEVL